MASSRYDPAPPPPSVEDRLHAHAKRLDALEDAVQKPRYGAATALGTALGAVVGSLLRHWFRHGSGGE